MNIFDLRHQVEREVWAGLAPIEGIPDNRIEQAVAEITGNVMKRVGVYLQLLVPWEDVE